MTEPYRKADNTSERDVLDQIKSIVRYFVLIWLIPFFALWLLFGFVNTVLITLIALSIVAYLVNGWIRQIPAQPPYVGLRTIMGKKTNTVIPEGWVLRIPGVFDFIPIKVERANQDIEPHEVFSEEGVPLYTDVSVTWEPDQKRLIEYINNGMENGIKKMLERNVEDALRVWAKDRSLADCSDAESAEHRITERTDSQQLGISINRLNIRKIKPDRDIVQMKTAQIIAGKQGMSVEKAMRMIKEYRILEEGGKVTPGLADSLSELDIGRLIIEMLKR